jgi:hypothetical protein
MKVQVVLTFNTYDEAKEFMNKEAVKTAGPAEPIPVSSPETTQAPPDLEKPKKKRGRKPRSKVDEDKTSVPAAPLEGGRKEGPTKPKYTKADCVNALEKLNNAKGLNTAKSALGKFKATRISDLKAFDYRPFCEYAHKLAAEA